MSAEYIEIWGAKAHNLKNIDLQIPRHKLVVITGLSGSGKSSLAFDTLYAEGQRRYMETISVYARQFVGSLERPDVDKIDGLSPVISIEQKTTNKNPRSTVGTITEIYDYLRLLFARVGEAYSYNTGEKMVKYTEKQILELIQKSYLNEDIYILAPIVKGRKGHYREVIENIRKQGYLRLRIDGEIQEITFGMHLDRYKVHDIEVIVDQLSVKEENLTRLQNSVQSALKQGKGLLMILNKKTNETQHYSKLLICPTTGISYPEPEPNLFSFNSPYGTCPHCKGLGNILLVDEKKLIPSPHKSIHQGGIAPIDLSVKSNWKNDNIGTTWLYSQVKLIAEKFQFNLDSPIKDIPAEALKAILYGIQEQFEVKNTYLGVTQKQELHFCGIIQHIEDLHQDPLQSIQKWAEQFMEKKECPHCHGTRLQITALHFKIAEKNIADLAQLNLTDLYQWFKTTEKNLSKNQKIRGSEIIKEIQTRIQFLLDVGVGYLSLSRNSASLSGGESQRIRLATQIGTKLVGVLYILDEPSIGLHQRDNQKLIQALKDLRDLGNSVIVVEHDKDMILAADYVIDIGPGAGLLGGKVMAQGSPKDFIKQNSITTDYLNGKKSIPLREKVRKGNGKEIILKGACGNNLKNINVCFPLGTFICVTGVSGSGKSTLINHTLYPILSQKFYRSLKAPHPYKQIQGIEHIDKVIEVDQSPIGRTPRSNPATYIGVFDDIRKLYASLPDAKIRNYSAGRFSFNVKGGRCEACGGAGVQTIEMNFLPDVFVHCEECNGKRYNRETLEIRYKGKSITDVLNMSITQSLEFFEQIPSIHQKLKAFEEVGLGYITLGQQSTTLSGGEAQRVKLASELCKKSTGNTLYILDEPTTGLHFEDIRLLLEVLQKLVDQGNTVIVIEHQMDIIKSADYIIDIGPEGGKEGGNVVVTGTPQKVIQEKKSQTGKFLALEL